MDASDEWPGSERAGGEEPDGLEAELRERGRAVRVPDVSGETMTERVLAQIIADGARVTEEPPAGSPAGLRARPWYRSTARQRLPSWVDRARASRKSLVTALCGLLAVLVLTPPVRAAVVDWFDFGGVDVRYDPTVPAPRAAVVPDCGPGVSIAEAERLAGFRPAVPESELGAPDTVAVSGGREGRRVVSLCWRSGSGRDPAVVRLDQFRAQLDPAFGKVSSARPEWVQAGSGSALWFAVPHRLQIPMRDPSGATWVAEQRTAGPTLLWVHGRGLTLRLEGIGSVGRAVAVAESAEAEEPAEAEAETPGSQQSPSAGKSAEEISP